MVLHLLVLAKAQERTCIHVGLTQFVACQSFKVFLPVKAWPTLPRAKTEARLQIAEEAADQSPKDNDTHVPDGAADHSKWETTVVQSPQG